MTGVTIASVKTANSLLSPALTAVLGSYVEQPEICTNQPILLIFMMKLRVTILISGIAVLAGCAEPPQPRSVQEFLDNPLVLEAALVRCARNRSETRYDAECVNAREANKLVSAQEEAKRRAEFEASDRVRTHFHLPVFWDEPDAPLGSTRAEMVRFLEECPGPLPLLEVETYTWSVLGPEWLADRSLSDRVVEELGYVAAAVGRRA